MTPDRWIALLAIAVAVLAIAVPVIVTLAIRRADRDRATIDKQAETIQRQRDAIIDYKIALGQLTHTAESVNRTLGALPIPQDGGGI